MTFYITFQMYTHTYTATHHEDSGWWNLKEWVIENIDRIEKVLNVESPNEQESLDYFEALQNVISHWKNQQINQ